jgi:hypothetical protein
VNPWRSVLLRRPVCHRHPLLVEPGLDIVGIEPNVVADLEIRDAPLLDEPADVTLAGSQLLSQLGDVDQLRSAKLGSNPAAVAAG